MYIVQILKRKDAAAVVVAIVVGMIVGQYLMSMTSEIAGKIAGQDQYGMPGGSWKNTYLYSTVWAALQLIALELLARVYVWLHGNMAASAKKK